VKIGIIGAGAVGGTLAALLARAGHRVDVTARGEHLDAILEHGIVMDGVWGGFTALVDAARVLDAGIQRDLVILAVKTTGTADALRENAAAVAGTPLLVVQNGLDAIDVAEQIAPDAAAVLGGLATWASSHLSPGHVTVTGSGRLFIGAGRGAPTPVVRRIAHTLAAAVDTSVVDDFAGAQWTKLIINQVNALPAITGLSVQEVVEDNRLRRALTASMREAVRVGLGSGIAFERLQGLSDATLRRFAKLPLWLGQGVPKAMAERMGRVPNPGSTLQSIRRGQPTEIDSLNGAVVRVAEATGQDAPLNRLMAELVHRVERTGEFVPVDEVVALAEAMPVPV
jgi:2-dehydropantoate 2-reductase